MTYPNVYASQTGPLSLSGLDANFLYAVDIANGALSATAGGTADALTATYSPAPAALVAGLTLYLRAASANVTTTPQFSPNGLTGKTIVKNNNQALAVGDIAGAGHWLQLVYDATNGVWELMNPATVVGAVQTGGTANGVAYLNASKVITSGTAFVFDGTNVGIGTSSPATEGTNVKLAIVGTTGQQASSLATSNSNAGFTVRANLSSGYQLAIGATNNGSIPYIQGVNYNGGAASADLAIQAYGGNVGIGTVSPSKKVEVYAASNSLQIESIVRNDQAGSGVAAIGFNVSSSAASETTSTKAGIGLVRSASYGVGSLCFYNNGTSSAGDFTTSDERMRITSAGGLAVGTTSDPGAGAIYATGNITAYFSDDRLKTRFGNIENALDKVKSLDGFYYEANQTAQDLGYKPVREAGVSAQQVQAILPEVVKPAPIDQQYLTVDYERLVPLLIEAIKELNGKVEILEAKLKEV